MKKQFDFIAPHHLSSLPANTPILLALSGGADSRALLDMLSEYCKAHNTPLAAAHVNHMIRGKDAERDRDFCRTLAKAYSIPFYLLEADVPSLAKANGRGLEEEARIVRYAFFASVMKEHSIPLLATAHNATDNAETVIFNIARGSGLRGLCGIPPTRKTDGGTVIRPLLKISKDDILTYCHQKGLEYVTDATNCDVEYSRNRIRNNIIPELLKINENAISNIERMSYAVRNDDDFLNEAANKYFLSLGDSSKIPTKSFSELEGSLKARVASRFLKKYFSPASAHIESFIELVCKAEEHSRLDFPNQTAVKIERGFAVISNSDKTIITPQYELKLSYGLTVLDGTEAAIYVKSSENAELSENEYARLQNVYKKSTSAFLSSDKIDKGLFVRPKCDGDKIFCGGMHKKLKKLFCEKKLPLCLRAKLPVFFDNGGIVWVPLTAVCDSEKTSDKQLLVTYFYN